MNQIKNKIFLIAIICLISSLKAIAQQDDFTVIRINNTEYKNNYTEMIFDLEIRRKTLTWDRWANGTFQFDFDDKSLEINDQLYKFERYNDGGITWTNIVTAVPTPDKGYYSKTLVEPGRFVIGIIGPKTYQECELVPSDTYLKLGTFRVISLSGKKFLKDDQSGPIKLEWKLPYNYYQATDYKTPTRIDINQVQEFYSLDDNIELRDPFDEESIQFINDVTPGNKFELLNFSARYVGLKKILLDWETQTEFNNQGFLFKRIIRPAWNQASLEDLDFSKSNYIRSFNDGSENAKQLLSKSNIGSIYQYTFDTAGPRGSYHCYQLSYLTNFGDTVTVGETCVFVPNAVITYAQNNPNPFEKQTTVEYTVEDNVNLEINLYDGTGRMVKQVLKQINHPKGTFSMDLVMPEFSMQGLYDLVFIAYPIDDPSVELSRAVVKMQVIR